jgi:hypothetical protein
MDFRPDGIVLTPWLPPDLGAVEISNLRYRKARMTIRVEGQGSVSRAVLDDSELSEPRIPASIEGDHTLRLYLESGDGRRGAKAGS